MIKKHEKLTKQKEQKREILKQRKIFKHITYDNEEISMELRFKI